MKMLYRVRTCAPLSTILMVSVFASPIFAHGDHGGGGGTVLPAGITLVTAEVDYVKFQPLSDARLTALAEQGEGGVHSLKSIAVPSLSIARGITDDLTLGIRLPYLANREIRETDVDNAGITARGGVYGFGDTTVTATYRFLREDTAGVEAAMIVGVKVPTGRSDALDNQGVLFETEHQPGSGSWDGVFGVALARQIGAWSLSSSALYNVAGDGDQSTNLGDRFSAGFAVSYRFVLAGTGSPAHLGANPPAGMMHHGGHDHVDQPSAHGSSGLALDLSLGISGEWQESQTIAGERDHNTGGNITYVTPGVRISNEQTTTSLTLGIPVSSHLNGDQSEPDWRLASSFGVRF